MINCEKREKFIRENVTYEVITYNETHQFCSILNKDFYAQLSYCGTTFDDQWTIAWMDFNSSLQKFIFNNYLDPSYSYFFVNYNSLLKSYPGIFVNRLI